MTARWGALAAFAALTCASARAEVDAPLLAASGPHGVAVASLTLAGADHRTLVTDVWYPATPKSDAAKMIYAGALTGEDGRDVAFTQAGTAVRGAPADPGSFPLVILAHGYGGTPVAMSWLAENLASKGYVVVGPHFTDPPITDTTRFREVLMHRPVDVGLVVSEAQARAGHGDGPLAGADGARTVLIGYSIGGYGAAQVAGAEPSACLKTLTGGVTVERAAKLSAVVLISPMTRVGACEAWGLGAAAIRAPTLLIVGDHDRLVGYNPGVETLFERETGADRYLLTFQNAGHSIGMNAAPDAMRGRLWDQDWFEDPVWRKDRLVAIQLHFITAFLDGVVKGDAAHKAYLDVPQPGSDQGVWLERPGEPYAAYSPGKPTSTVWPGFQRGHDVGLSLRFAPATP